MHRSYRWLLRWSSGLCIFIEINLTGRTGAYYMVNAMNAVVTQPISFASAYRQLTPPQKAFVDAYVADLERQAARNNERISLALYRTIPANVVEASRGMLDSPLVRAAITERINEIAAASELTVHRVVKELMGVAFASVGDFMEVGEDGQPYFDLTRATPEQLAAIKSIKIEETGDGLSRPKKRKFEFQLHDKLAGIKMLAEYMGLLQAENPHWRADNARPVGQRAVLPADASVEAAGDMYSAMING